MPKLKPILSKKHVFSTMMYIAKFLISSFFCSPKFKNIMRLFYVYMLVYYEGHELYIEAARREKRFKNWPRK
jgi:hypothetical protein